MRRVHRTLEHTCDASECAPGSNGRSSWRTDRVEFARRRERQCDPRASAKHGLSGAVTSVVSRLTRVQPSVQRQRIQPHWEALLDMADEFDRFLVPSLFMKDEMLRFGLPEVAIDLVELGTAVHHQGAARDVRKHLR